jgi:hypothetical protein
MAMVPAILLLNSYRMLVRLVMDRGILEDYQAFVLVLPVHAMIAYCFMVWADMAMTRWIVYTRTNEGSVKGWFQQMWAAWKAYPGAVYATVFTAHPIRHGLAHIVCLQEDLGPQAARARSAHLLNGSEHLMVALMVRRFPGDLPGDDRGWIWRFTGDCLL